MKRLIVNLLLSIVVASTGLMSVSVAGAVTGVSQARASLPGTVASIHLLVDVDNDGLLDAVSDSTWLVNAYADGYEWAVAVRRGLPGGSLAATEICSLGPTGYADPPDQIERISAVDYDGDGWSDLIVEWSGIRGGCCDVGGLVALHNRHDGTFSVFWGPGAMGAPQMVAVDLNGDNRLDFAMYSTGFGHSYEAAVTTGLTLLDGSFAAHEGNYRILTALAPIHLETSDVDHDGRLDIVLRHPTDSVWYRSVGDGRLESPRPLPVPGAIDLDDWSLGRTLGGVALTWRLSPVARGQFVSMYIETAPLEGGPYQKVREAAPVSPDSGTWTDAALDAYVDRWYRLVFVSLAGASEASRPLHAEASLTSETMTLTAAGTRAPVLVRYSVPRLALVTLALYNARGEYEDTLVHETAERGIHTLIWNGRRDDADPLARGVYFLRLEGGGGSVTRKLVLTR